jgi:hypothetical protein
LLRLQGELGKSSCSSPTTSTRRSSSVTPSRCRGPAACWPSSKPAWRARACFVGTALRLLM